MTYDPSTRNIVDMERDLIAFAIESEKTGLEWAKAQALFEQLDDMKKVALADSMPKLTKLDPKMSQSEKEQIALCSDAFKAHLEGLAEARRKANEAKVRYSAAQAKFDAIRTILTNKRELTKRGIDA